MPGGTPTRTTWAQRVRVLPDLIPPFVIFLAVIGSIYAGWATATESLRKARQDWGLSGLMESHHYGWWPSFVSELAKNAYWTGGVPTGSAVM